MNKAELILNLLERLFIPNRGISGSAPNDAFHFEDLELSSSGPGATKSDVKLLVKRLPLHAKRKRTKEENLEKTIELCPKNFGGFTRDVARNIGCSWD